MSRLERHLSSPKGALVQQGVFHEGLLEGQWRPEQKGHTADWIPAVGLSCTACRVRLSGLYGALEVANHQIAFIRGHFPDRSSSWSSGCGHSGHCTAGHRGSVRGHLNSSGRGQPGSARLQLSSTGRNHCEPLWLCKCTRTHLKVVNCKPDSKVAGREQSLV